MTVDQLAFHTLQQLIRKGLLDLDDVEEIAERLRDEENDDAAIAVRGSYVEAHASPEPGPDPRLNLRLVANNRQLDGGNDGGT